MRHASRAGFLWTWLSARISVMGGEQAATALAMVKREGFQHKGRECQGQWEPRWRDLS